VEKWYQKDPSCTSDAEKCERAKVLWNERPREEDTKNEKVSCEDALSKILKHIVKLPISEEDAVTAFRIEKNRMMVSTLNQLEKTTKNCLEFDGGEEAHSA